jgi:hypothetical protein
MKLIETDGVEMPFDASWKNIAISMSGGADSTLLAYLLCNLIGSNDIKVHVISHRRMWKTRPWQSYDSLNIFDSITEMFPKINFERHINFIAPDVEYGNMGPTIKDEYGKMVSGENAQQRAYAEYICHYRNIDAYYNAVTRNPRNVDFTGMIERDIELTPDTAHLRIMQHMDRWALHPFRFVDKAWIIKQYKRLGIMALLHKTRSCEGEFSGLDYLTYQEGDDVPICGECFWCKEREWAIEQNK